MAVLNAFDYSWSRPDPGQMHVSGIQAVARYLFDDGSGGKGLDRSEILPLHSRGMGIVQNAERDAGNHLLGANQGAEDGQAARAIAAELGLPIGTPIYYSCDREVSDTQMPIVMDYLRAADSAVHPSRCYGQFSVCEAWGRKAWQTIAWSGGRLSSNAVLYQWAIDQDFHGSAVDYNQIINAAELGAWWPNGVHPESAGAKPLVVKKPWEEDMQFIRFINSGPKNNNFAVYQVVGDKLLYINPLTNGWLGKPKPLVVDKRSSYWLMPMVAGSPDFRGK